MPTHTPKEKRLRSAIRRSLRAQGFRITGNRVGFRQKRDKRSIRKRHEHAVEKRISMAQNSLARDEDKLLAYIASGSEIDPAQIKPKLVQVEPDTIESRLFRYACLHWSIPVSEGYGLYRLFRDPHSSFDTASRQYSFMTIGPVSPLSFAGTPLFLNVYNSVEAFMKENKLSMPS